MSRVIVRHACYDYQSLRPVLFEMIEALVDGEIHRNARVLLKPNFLCPAKPERAVLTHPLVVRAVSEYLLSKGCKIQISDSPAMGSFQKVLKEGGYQHTFAGMDVNFVPFTGSVKKDIGPPFGEIEMATDAIAFDTIINLAKLKTHSQMLLTLGVKNMFGCIVGMRKPEWHLKAGVDRNMFAKLLVQICQSIRPSITIIDGILALEGQGPGRSGTPRQLNVLVGSRNPFAADMAVCRMLCLEPGQLPTHAALGSMGLSDDSISIDGDLPQISNFKLPVLAPLSFGPKRIQGFMRKHLLQRPVVDQKRCKLCGECWNYCPSEAIFNDTEHIIFDYAACIRCYCCIELCPHGALKAKETSAGRVIRRLLF
ncbi:MAG: DUF362 domain-containing protein [Deltaproteobacteria bacterium]|nr:DUF362 domain-containing protein [Deltaproteobacteria bacterium]